jgi:hypothetical protein
MESVIIWLPCIILLGDKVENYRKVFHRVCYTGHFIALSDSQLGKEIKA